MSKNRGMDFMLGVFFVLATVMPARASITGIACCDLRTDIVSNLESQAPSPKDISVRAELLKQKFVSNLASLLRALSIPASSQNMYSCDQWKLADLCERKKEILKCLDSIISGGVYWHLDSEREASIKVRGLPLFGAIGAMLDVGTSVRHLWGTNLRWLRFKSSCKSGQTFAQRIQNIANFLNSRNQQITGKGEVKELNKF